MAALITEFWRRHSQDGKVQWLQMKRARAFADDKRSYKDVGSGKGNRERRLSGKMWGRYENNEFLFLPYPLSTAEIKRQHMLNRLKEGDFIYFVY